jgi:DNA anti-recombination protein RmuC
MGLFNHKQDNSTSIKDDAMKVEEHFFDEYFREELRNHGRWYFEKVITENGELFKKDLDATIAQLNIDLKDRATSQLDDLLATLTVGISEHVNAELDSRFVEATAVIKTAQEAAVTSLNESAKAVQDQFQELNATVQKNVADQEALMRNSLEENTARISAIRQSQDSTLQTLIKTTESLQQSFQQLSTTVQKNVETQEALLVKGFEENMGRIIEHYLLTAVGEQFDLKSQLPSIIQRMENNKQAILDDISL